MYLGVYWQRKKIFKDLLVFQCSVCSEYSGYVLDVCETLGPRDRINRFD
jgi:hypothetical protein